MHRLIGSTLLLLALPLPQVLHAQLGVTIGQRVRVSSATGRATGVVIRTGTDGLTVAEAGREQTWRAGEITSLDVAAGKKRATTALIGGVAGAVAVGLLSVATSSTDEEIHGSLADAATTGEAFAIGAAVGGVLGVVLGATVFAPTRWVPARLGGDGMDLALAPARSGGWRLGFTTSF